jgi:glycosyltransferase involved in cell wall biosynthesis
MSEHANFTPSLAHRVWRMLPVRQRRLALSHYTAIVAPRPDRTPPPAVHGIAVAGELGCASGLGEGARLMLRGLEKLEVPCWPVAVPSPCGCADMPVPQLAAPPPGAPLVIHVNAPMLPWAMRNLRRIPLRRRRVIGYWAWELQTIPADWRPALSFVHEVWVPSRFTAAALETLAPGRVRIVPPAIGALPARRALLTRSDFGLPDTALIVLVAFNLASSFERKNPLAAIAAFRAAFGERKDRLLLLKIANPNHFPPDFARIRDAVAGSENIRIDARTLPAADHAALTACADIILSLHRSEGLGLVPAEAMLLGKPVIATGWSGNLDYMDAQSAALVGCRLVPARDPRLVYQVPGAVWAEPDIGEAAAQLGRLAADPAERVALGARGRAMVMARLGTAGLADAVRGLGLVGRLSIAA